MTETLTYDFEDANGPVPAHRHSNGGGWVADSSEVSEFAYVGPAARVSGGKVCGGEIRGDARIYGGLILGGVIRAEVYGGVILGEARIYGGAVHGGVVHGVEIHGGVIRGGLIRGDARIYGGLILGGVIRGDARIYGGVVHDDARIYGGEIRGGEIRGGVIRSSNYHHLTVTNDGDFITANWLDGEWRINARCRDFSIQEARAHWGAANYHTPSSGSRIVAMLDWLETQPTP